MHLSSDIIRQKLSQPLPGLSSHLKLAPPERAKEIAGYLANRQNANPSPRQIKVPRSPVPHAGLTRPESTRNVAQLRAATRAAATPAGSSPESPCRQTPLAMGVAATISAAEMASLRVGFLPSSTSCTGMPSQEYWKRSVRATGASSLVIEKQ